MLDFVKKLFSTKRSAPVVDEEDIVFFNGHIEHGYSLSKVENENQCPRCEAPTLRLYANFIYNNQERPRLLTARAGYFCTKCSTVIVDEKLLRKEVPLEFEYMGTLGLGYEDNRPPDIFTTWNGKPFDFILGESLVSSLRGNAFSAQRWEKIKRKKQMARESRKRNRRK